MQRKSKVLIGAGTLGGVAVLSIGGVSMAFANGSSHHDDHGDSPLSGSTLQQASAAALKAAGGGKVTDSGGSGESGSVYNVEVTTSNGTQVDVHLDKGFAVVSKETEAKDGSENALTGSTLQQASAVALKAAGGGKVTDSGGSDESGSVYDVEVTTSNGKQVDVHLDKSFSVVKKEVDTES